MPRKIEPNFYGERFLQGGGGGDLSVPPPPPPPPPPAPLPPPPVLIPEHSLRHRRRKSAACEITQQASRQIEKDIGSREFIPTETPRELKTAVGCGN